MRVEWVINVEWVSRICQRFQLLISRIFISEKAREEVRKILEGISQRVKPPNQYHERSACIRITDGN